MVSCRMTEVNGTTWNSIKGCNLRTQASLKHPFAGGTCFPALVLLYALQVVKQEGTEEEYKHKLMVAGPASLAKRLEELNLARAAETEAVDQLQSCVSRLLNQLWFAPQLEILYTKLCDIL